MRPHIIIERPGRRQYWISFGSVILSGVIWFLVGYCARPILEGWLK